MKTNPVLTPPPPLQMDRRIVSHLRKYSRHLAGLAVLLALVTIIEGMMSFSFDLLSLSAEAWKYIPCLGILLAAACLRWENGFLQGIFLLGILLLLALLISSHVAVIEGMRQLFFKEEEIFISEQITRYVWGGTIALLLTALILLLLSSRIRLYFYGQCFACLLFLVAYICLLAYLVGKATFQTIAHFALLPPLLSLAFLLLALAFLLVYPDQGLTRLLSSIHAGSRNARKAFVGMIFSPLAASLLITFLLPYTSFTAAFGLVLFFVLYFSASLTGAYLNFMHINHFDFLQAMLLQENYQINLILKQSNEEVTALNEELKSALEEYHTVNEQLQLASKEIQVLMEVKLLESETKFKQLTESITDLFLAFDGTLTYVYWNQACEVTFGQKAEQVLGKRAGQILPFFADIAGESLLKGVLTSQQARVFDYELSQADSIQTGKGACFQVSVFPSHIGLSVLMKDISEKKKKEHQLLQINQQLTERNFELDQIVYKISHDIRSPLASVLGLLHLMQREEMEQGLREYITRMQGQVLKLDRLTKLMLEFARTTRSGLQSDQVDFKLLHEQCLEQLEYLPHFSRLHVSLQQEGIYFYSDVLHVQIIFANLLANAIKYQNVGCTHSYLLVNIRVNEQEASLTFTDNGIGIDPTYLPRIFDMFFRASNQSTGSGLGMYIVKQTVEKLKGRIKLESNLGEGTVISIYLPNLLLTHSIASAAASTEVD